MSGRGLGDRITQRPSASGAVGLRPLALGTPTACPQGFDSCDPYCNIIVDAPGGFSAGPNFSNTTSGFTPTATGVGNCTSLALAVSTSTALVDNKITVTSLSPLTTVPPTSATNPLGFALTGSPSGCATSPFETTWTVDRVDRAAISGTNSEDGALTLGVPLSGNIRVTAFALGLTVSIHIPVRVNVLVAPTTSGAATPNANTTSTNINAFSSGGVPLAGTINSTATWLYPYASTYFPLGLLAPVIQYRYSTTTGNGKAVKVSLRYPANKTIADSDFNYSLIVAESNRVSALYGGVAANVLDPQVIIPQDAWQYLEQTARDDDADLVVQRLQSSLERESRIRIHFVDGQLKGTVYYNSYTSPLGGNVGAVLRIAPGASAPTVAVQTTSGSTRRCTVCHSLNQDGSRLIANTDLTSLVTNGVKFNNSRRYDISGSSPVVLNTYLDSDGQDFVPGDYDAAGDRYTFGAPWIDGGVYMTHGGSPTYAGDRNWRAPPDYSKLYRPESGVAVTVGSWTNISAVTPRFSPQGSGLAFGFWGASGSTLPCSSSAVSPCALSSGTRKLGPVSAGTRLAVVDFSAPSNRSSSSGWSVSNARDVTPGVTHRVAWPSFTPDGAEVIYQRQIRGSGAVHQLGSR